MNNDFKTLIPDSGLVSIFVGKNDHLDETLERSGIKNIVEMKQVHGNNIAEITKVKITSGNRQIIPDVDALITTQKNITLAVKTADCLPILVHWQNNWSPTSNEKSIIAAIHAGRAGTEKRILEKVLKHLKNKYLMNPENGKLTIWLGPAICKDCYQIDEETNLHYDLYQENIEQIEKVFPEIKFSGKKHSKSQPKNRIKIIRSQHCTLHNNEQFFSYRKSGKGVKMNYSLIQMI